MSATFLTVLSIMLVAVGCNVSQTTDSSSVEKLKTVRLHIDGFQKSKSGAIWMGWPEKVKQALEELAAVRKIEMVLERDEFTITYDPTKATEELLIATVKKSGYTAQVISGQPNEPVSENNSALPQGFPLLDEALARAKKEQKPIVLDFYAEWWAPCRQMDKTTFTDDKVKALLDRAIWLKIDTDKEAELSKQLGVVGLPDIRFVMPDGKVFRQLRGYQDAESFVAELESLLKQTQGK